VEQKSNQKEFGYLKSPPIHFSSTNINTLLTTPTSFTTCSTESTRKLQQIKGTHTHTQKPKEQQIMKQAQH
jgi:hypothetical protein